jgi:ribonuclease Z
MKLHCLGTAGYHPNNFRHTSCYSIPEANLVLDAGTGFYRIAESISQESLHILLSHAHLDHSFGLTYVIDFLATTCLKEIHVYAQREKIQTLCEHLFHPLLFPVLPSIQWHALEDLGSHFTVEQTKIEWFPLEHPGGSVGYRLDWQSTSLAYVTDTTCRVGADYWKRILGVEWLLHECNFSDDYEELAEKTGHSCLTPVLEASFHAKIPRLILSHFNPLSLGDDPIGLEAATSKNLNRTPPQVVLATDGLTIDLSRL